MPKKGLEPPHPCGYMDLNHARLPIPPLRLVTIGQPGEAAIGKNNSFIFYRRSQLCQTATQTCQASCVATHPTVFTVVNSLPEAGILDTDEELFRQPLLTQGKGSISRQGICHGF